MIKNIVIGVLAVLALLFGGLYLSNRASGVNVGAVSGQIFYQTAQFVQGLVIGDRGSEVKGVFATTCNMGTLGTASINASHAASTTKSYFCPVTGMTSSYRTFAQLASSTAVNTTNIGWVIIGSKASSTAAGVDILLSNMTGAAAIPSVTSVGSSTPIWAFKN